MNKQRKLVPLADTCTAVFILCFVFPKEVTHALIKKILHISPRATQTYLEKQLDPRGPIASQREYVPVFLRKPIATCDFKRSGCKLFDILMVFLKESFFVCLFDLILYAPSTIFQLNRDWSSWDEPVLSLDKCVLLKDHNVVTPVRLQPATPLSRVKHSTTEPLLSRKNLLKIWISRNKNPQRTKKYGKIPSIQCTCSNSVKGSLHAE